ncbi:hypothetical protein G9A89_002629 [Geosiphon pyriformis]|nr:hypothetical protein G9A89_002629 [Geosiphon pyriformis]
MIIRHTILRILNVISYFLLFGYHAKIWYLDEPKGEKDNHLTYFTPVQWADYTIWGLIHFLFFGFIFYQWFDSAAEQIIEGISGRSIGSENLDSCSILGLSWLGCDLDFCVNVHFICSEAGRS